MAGVIPGPYSLCHVTFPDPESDSATYTTLRYGYDTANEALSDLEVVAGEKGVPSDEVAIIRYVDVEEIDRFID
jgi:ACT domain-containing protein